MWSFRTEITVAAPPDRLWQLFKDVERWEDWNAGVEEIRLLGPFANGSRFIMKPPGMEPLTSTLSDVREGQGFTDVTLLGDNLVTVFHELAPLPDGRTRVVYRAEVIGPGADQIGPAATGDFDEVLLALKRKAEAEASSPSPK